MKITPMMEQYLDAKQHYPDALLFFRMGDFYEMFFEDAVTAAREVGLTLTARNKGEPDEIPMAGVPHFACEGYIAKLLERGLTVAICEQLEDPKATKGLVRRGVTRVITPGTVLDAESLDARAHNYLAAVCLAPGKKDLRFGLAYLDASTGDFQATELQDTGELLSELGRVAPREVVVPRGEEAVFAEIERRLPGVHLRVTDPAGFDPQTTLARIEGGDALDSDKVQETHWIEPATAASFFQAIDHAHFAQPEGPRRAVAGVLAYLIYAQRGVSAHITQLQPYQVKDFLILDESTRANLELTETLMGGRKVGSLLNTLDQTATAMGARRLRSWLQYPLVNAARIQRRLDAVGELKDNLGAREHLRDLLGQTYDIERLTGRVTSGLANARDLLQLKASLAVIPRVREVLLDARSELLRIVSDRLDPCEELCDLIARAIADEPPTHLREGGLIRRGYHPELDDLIEISEHGKDWILRYEARERERTGISSLKVKYNKVFGYFIEITRANFDKVPDDYLRKQTLANAERFYTLDLKEYEDKVLNAEDRRVELEYQLFEELRATAATYVARLRHIAYMLSTLDVLTTLALLAHTHGYARPEIHDGPEIIIHEGRHPVVEHTLQDGRFVPNSVHLDCKENQLMIITGPNMAGKSTVIRQVALITLMAQMGSFVPAASARIGVVDKIFSRVGASDNLAKGQSTFMVEMTETAHILRNATSKSLIILDEIGRGTSTYDGLSIAWSVAEFLHDEVGAKTLFATHYHELTELPNTHPGVRNFNIAVKEWNDDIIFLRKLVPGPANRSYGIQVGRLAGLPDHVVDRAKEILANLEAASHDEGGASLIGRHGASGGPQPKPAPDSPQLSLLALNPAASKQQAARAAGSARNIAAIAAAPAPTPAPAPAPAPAPLHPALREALEAIKGLSLETTTPLEALNLLFQLKKRVQSVETPAQEQQP